MTLSEAAYNLLNLLRGGRSTNNEHLSPEQIKFNIRYYRSLIIRRDVDRGGRTYELEQDLGLVPVEMVDPAEGGLPDFKGLVLRTQSTIPTPVRLREKSGITSVHTPDRRYSIPLIDFQAARWQTHNKFTSRQARSFLLNDKVYVIGDKLTEAVNAILQGTQTLEETPAQSFLQGNHVVVRGIFEDPRKAWEFANPTEEWDDDAQEYPLPEDIYQRIVQSLLSGEFKLLLAVQPDNTADQIPS